MKETYYNNYMKQILFIFIMININQIVISDNALYIMDLNYTHALSLINGNIFIFIKMV